jgi:hypothetical protein
VHPRKISEEKLDFFLKKKKIREFFYSRFDEVWGECVATIEEILFTRICGVKKVRGEVAEHSDKVKPEDIQDCITTPLTPGPCTVPCDDQLNGGIPKS